MFEKTKEPKQVLNEKIIFKTKRKKKL